MGIRSYEVIIFANFIHFLWNDQPVLQQQVFSFNFFPSVLFFIYIFFFSFSTLIELYFSIRKLSQQLFNMKNEILRFSVIFYPFLLRNNAGPFRISMAHKYIIRAHECPINNTFTLHPPIPYSVPISHTVNIISINTFITIISQPLPERFRSVRYGDCAPVIHA